MTAFAIAAAIAAWSAYVLWRDPGVLDPNRDPAIADHDRELADVLHLEARHARP